MTNYEIDEKKRVVRVSVKMTGYEINYTTDKRTKGEEIVIDEIQLRKAKGKLPESYLVYRDSNYDYSRSVNIFLISGGNVVINRYSFHDEITTNLSVIHETREGLANLVSIAGLPFNEGKIFVRNESRKIESAHLLVQGKQPELPIQSQ